MGHTCRRVRRHVAGRNACPPKKSARQCIQGGFRTTLGRRNFPLGIHMISHEPSPIENRDLRLHHLPADDADWSTVGRFALTFDGYNAFGDKCGEIANRGNPSNLTEMRACLFFEQRRWRHFGSKPDAEGWVEIRNLIQDIRRKVEMLPFLSVAAAKKNGFCGFLSTRELRTRLTEIPDERGIYLVFWSPESVPEFLLKSPAGWLKKKDPTLPLDHLKEKWVPGAQVLYIGKAGGSHAKATLHTRLKTYLKHGAGSLSPHWGGRLIWQIENAESLLTWCWKTTPSDEPRIVEHRLIRDFIDVYTKLPFANRCM